MNSKIQPISGMEDTIKTSTKLSPKVSLFAKKTGFVIPKNKLSGSLVPVFRGGKKPGGADVDNEESTKPVVRKTKWGPDLTQDAFVKKGRASAYQTRLDQITQQINLFMEAIDDHDLLAHGETKKEADRKNTEKSESLILERHEVIGEILKLNPSYKAPSDYKPLLKEAKVAIPIKEYPGRNFIAIIFGPAGDTQKRLEKETGAKIRVYGTKTDTKKEIEITLSDGNEVNGDCEELWVLVTAETYDKVDAAVSLIELLFTPVSANTVAGSTKDADSKDNPNGQDAPVSPMVMNPRVAQPFTGPGPGPAPLAQFQPYPNQWVPPGQSPRFISPSNSAPMQPSFGLRTGAHGPVPSQPHLNPHMGQVPNMGYPGPPRNPGPPRTQTGPNQNMRPMGSPVTRSAPPLTSGGWAPPPVGPNVQQMMRPMVRPPPLPQQVGPTGAPNTPPPRSSWSVSVPPPPPSMRAPPVTAPRPQQPSSNDFTFQTPSSQPAPSPRGSHFIPPRGPQSPLFRPGMNNHGPPPMMQGFRRPINMGQNQGPSTTMHPQDSRQPVFPGPGPGPRMGPGPRQFGPGPGPGSPVGPFPPRPGNMGQNHPSMGYRPQNSGPTNQQPLRGYSMGRPSRPQHIYDPFSPTVGPPHKPGNLQNTRKQESDPEYDDLMASVGVK